MREAYEQGTLRLEAHLHHKLPFRSDGYVLSLLLPPPLPGAAAGSNGAATVATAAGVAAGHWGSAAAAAAGALASRGGTATAGALGDQPHKLQEWFGGGPHLLLVPDSYSGRILDAQVGDALFGQRKGGLLLERKESA